jgi:tRNA(fMet)-specific endonuclease VapC
MPLRAIDYLFDTSVFIAYFRQDQTAHALFKQASSMSSHIYYSIVTETELWAGIRANRTEAQHIQLLKPFQRLGINVTMARHAGDLLKQFGAIKHQNVPSPLDCLIAATAHYHKLTVLTRNSADFKLFTTISCEFF